MRRNPPQKADNEQSELRQRGVIGIDKGMEASASYSAP